MLAVSKRQLNELREAKIEEDGRNEFEIKRLRDDLEIANQKAKVRILYGTSSTLTIPRIT